MLLEPVAFIVEPVASILASTFIVQVVEPVATTWLGEHLRGGIREPVTASACSHVWSTSIMPMADWQRLTRDAAMEYVALKLSKGRGATALHLKELV